jgi:hypothetical protein
MICICVSLSELGQGRDDGVDAVVGVREWWAVSAAPRELGRDSNHHWVLDEILGSQVANLLLTSVVDIDFWVEVGHFLHTEFSWISDVMEGFDLIQVEQIVSHPELIIVLHWSIKLLHELRPATAPGHCSIDLVLSLHEFVVLCLNFLNNIWGVDGSLI